MSCSACLGLLTLAAIAGLVFLLTDELARSQAEIFVLQAQALIYDYSSPPPPAKPRRKSTFKQPKHAAGVKVVDYARHDLPPLLMGERVTDLTSGVHFDNLLQDTPDELRPPSLIFFHGFETCPDADKELKFTLLAESKLPARERLLIAKYDLDASPTRAWFKFTPEMDLAARFGVTKCGTLVYAPRQCDGFTEWCQTPMAGKPGYYKAGCKDFKDACGKLVKHWDGKGVWASWVEKLMASEEEPMISPVLGSMADQGRWMRQRDDTTSDNEARNYFLVEAFPAFTEFGYLAVPTPPEVKEWLISFWERRKRNRVTEMWQSASTQMSFHEDPTTFVSLDQEGAVRDQLANQYLKPIVEKWSNMQPLELTSFYGIREYNTGSWLRNHVDRIDTHVLSITFTVGKLNNTDRGQRLTHEQLASMPTWPLEVMAYDGDVHRYDHPPDTMILYESSKLMHGRPYRNKGPPHMGAFVHFKPKNMNGIDAAEWDAIANYARAHQQANVRYGRYRSSRSVEPSKVRVRLGETATHARDGAAQIYDAQLCGQDWVREPVRGQGGHQAAGVHGDV
jgi:hypothetical protein